jgi:hypothetical protein
VLVAPAAVTLSQARVVLPSTIGYDVALCPLVLPVIMLAGALAAGRSHGAQRFRRLASVGGSAGPDALDGAARSKRAARRASRQPELRLGRNAARAMDGWLSASRPPSRPRGRAPAGRTARLRPASGVPGSASGLAWHWSRPPAPVHLRLAGGRRGDGVIGTGGLAAVGGPRRAQPGRHPGLLAGRGRQFRPHGAEPGGSASGTHHLTARPPLRRQPAIRFGGHRGDGSFGHTLSHPPTRPGMIGRRRQSAIRFGGHRGDGSFGQTLSHPLTRPGMIGRRRQSAIRFGGHRGDGSFGQTLSHPLTRPVLARGRRPAAIRFGQRGRASSRAWLRMGADRSAFAIAGASAVPSLKFSGRPAPASRRTTAVPRFHRKPALLQPTRMSSGVVPGGVLTEATFRARMRRPAPRRLRLAGGATGMLGGTGRGPRLRRPPTRTGRQPRFSYGKRSPLTVLARRPFGRRLGGRWLARWRVGSRSGVWLLGRRPGAWR